MDQIFSKDSFDRFGDDLAELLLSFIPLEDCFRFECLSKQWQRFVFSGQHELSIDDNSSVNVLGFETIVRKCPHIQYIQLIDNEGIHSLDPIFVLITRHCTRVTELHLKCRLSRDFHVKTILGFFRKFGHHLKTISVTFIGDIFPNDGYLVSLKEIFNYNVFNVCHNLEALVINHFNPIDSVRDEVLDQLLAGDSEPIVLQELRKILFIYDHSMANMWTSFGDIYGNRMKRIGVTIEVIDDSIGDQLYVKTLMTGLSRMNRLKSLDISYETSDQSLIRKLVDQLTPIGTNCVSLKQLVLDLDIFDANIMRDLWRVLNKRFANRLTHLTLIGEYPEDWELMDEAFSGFKRLKYLAIDSEGSLNNKFYDKISGCLPRLQYLDIYRTVISDQSLHSLSVFTKIQSIRLNGSEEFSDSSIAELLYKCPKTKRIVINGRLIVIIFV